MKARADPLAVLERAEMNWSQRYSGYHDPEFSEVSKRTQSAWLRKAEREILSEQEIANGYRMVTVKKLLDDGEIDALTANMLWQRAPTQRQIETDTRWALAYMLSIKPAPVKEPEIWFDEAADVSVEAWALLTRKAKTDNG